MQAVVDSVVKELTSAVETRADLMSNPMNIVGVGMAIMNKHENLSGSDKKALLVKALTSLASGPDGVLGTADDRIPKPIVDTIVSLIEGKLINSVLDLAVGISKGRFDLQQAVAVAKEAKETFTGCFLFLKAKGLFKKCFKPKK